MNPNKHYQVHLPTQATVAYGHFVCLVRPKKAEPNQMQFTVGGNRINYPGKVFTLTTEMLVAKMLFNSVIFMKVTQFMTMDISNFYLMTPLHRAKFIQIKLSDIPNEDIREYKLREKTTKNRSIYIRAKRGMYGLPQAGLLANKLLKNASTNTDTSKANWYLDYGNTTQDPHSSHWLLMILAVNMLAKIMHNISRTHSKNTTNLHAIGQANNTGG
jgi:hypothetical protein